MLQRVIQEKQKELKVLGGTLKQPGAVSQMKSLVSELMQYSVTPENWRSGRDREDLLGLKLKDVSRVYEGFTRYLAEKYLTGGGIAGAAVRRHRKIQAGEGQHSGAGRVYGIYPGPVPGSEEDVHPLPASLCDRYSGPEGGSVPGRTGLSVCFI